MKGKLYKPQNLPIPIKYSSSDSAIRNPRPISLECIWPSSIPDSWKRILQKKNLPNIKIHKSSRSTLEFLQETQKYIETIRKPMDSNELEMVPSSRNNSRSGPLRSKLASINPSPLEHRQPGTKETFMRHRRKLKKAPSLVPLLLFIPSDPLRPSHPPNPILKSYRDYK